MMRLSGRILTPDLTLEQSVMAVLLAWLPLYFPLAPMGQSYSPLYVVGIAFATLALRHSTLILLVNLGAAVWLRTYFQIPKGNLVPMQHEAVNPFLRGDWLYASAAPQLPMGNLFGGSLVAIGQPRYWDWWHAVILVIAILPFLRAPGFAALSYFLVASRIFPVLAFTNGGGFQEVGAAVTALAVYLLRGGLLAEGAFVAAFAVCFTRPLFFLLPFVALVLWRAGDVRAWRAFGGGLALFGALFVLPHPLAALRAVTSGVSAPIAAVSLGAVCVLLAAAWRTGSRDSVLCLGIVATMAAHRIAATDTAFWDLCALALPIAVFLAPAEGEGPLHRPVARVLCAWLAFIALAPVWVWVRS